MFSKDLEHYLTRLSYRCFIVAAIPFCIQNGFWPRHLRVVLEGWWSNEFGWRQGLEYDHTSKHWKAGKLYSWRTRLQQSQSPVYVHRDCRRFVDLRKRTDSLSHPKKLRSSTDVVFKWETCCFLCLKPVDLRNREIRYVMFVLYQFTQLWVNVLRRGMIIGVKQFLLDWKHVKILWLQRHYTIR